MPGGIHALEQNEASPASLQDCANCHPDLLIFVEVKGVVLVSSGFCVPCTRTYA